jgi:hypothetical protein
MAAAHRAENGWRKSGSSHPDDCVEVNLDHDTASIRDSKNAAGPAITLPTKGWRAFLAGLTHSR